MNDTLERLSRLLAKDYQVDPALLTPEASLESFGIDSLGLAELMFNIEDEFKVTIPDDPVTLLTVGDVVGYIDGLVAKQRAGDPASNVSEGTTIPSA